MWTRMPRSPNSTTARSSEAASTRCRTAAACRLISLCVGTSSSPVKSHSAQCRRWPSVATTRSRSSLSSTCSPFSPNRMSSVAAAMATWPRTRRRSSAWTDASEQAEKAGRTGKSAQRYPGSRNSAPPDRTHRCRFLSEATCSVGDGRARHRRRRSQAWTANAPPSSTFAATVLCSSSTPSELVSPSRPGAAAFTKMQEVVVVERRSATRQCSVRCAASSSRST